MLNLSPNPYAVYEIIFWLLGSLKDRTMDHVWLAAPLMLLGWLAIWSSSRALDALSLGEEGAAGLGTSIPRARLLIVAGVALSVGAGTAVAGAIGFIGLVVPHIIRILWGGDYKRLIPLSILGGAITLLVSDILARIVMAPGYLPVGIVTAMIGAPFFLWILRRAKKEVFW